MTTINVTQLTPKQEQLWNDTRAALIWHCPAFSHIFYTLLQNTGNQHKAVFTDSEAIPIAATDGSNIVLNTGPEGFFSFSLNQRLFIVAHEIMHCILNHCGISAMLKMRGKVAYEDGHMLPYDGEQMNCAEDYVINAILTESKVGDFPKRRDANGTEKPFGLPDAAIATSKDNSLDIYRKIFKKQPGGKGGGQGTPGGSGSGRFDVHLPPGTSTGKDPVTATSERNKAQWDTEVASAISAARAMGSVLMHGRRQPRHFG